MAKNFKKELKKNKEISYTNKDFNSFRSELQNYANSNFSDNIIDFSDASVGGMLLDLNAYVGDVLSYYLDHQFNENSLERAVESNNIERLIRETGTVIPPASPSYAEVLIRIIVPAQESNGSYKPNESYLPILQKNTIFSSPDGIEFTLMDDVDFAKKDIENKLLATISIAKMSGNIPTKFKIEAKGIVSSSKIETELINIDNRNVPFRKITLQKNNVVEIVSVVDSNGEPYYEVDSLSQDTVFKIYDNNSYDLSEVPSRLEMIHAPRRFIANRSLVSGKTTIQFGSGQEDVYDEDVIPDPSEHAITLYGDRETLPMIAIDPNSFLTTQTLGISPKDTVLQITYRHGGGLSHNVNAGQINSIKSLRISFPRSSSSSIETQVRSTISVFNPKRASGGEDEPSIEEMRSIALLNQNSQNRIVTREDLIARVYSMPANFGRVFRVAVSDNPRNPLSSQLYIISRNNEKKLTLSTDTLKKNLSKYLNRFRLVSDAIDILDSQIFNFGVNYSITLEKGFRHDSVLANINSKIKNFFNSGNQQINKPISIGEIESLIYTVNGVVSIANLNIVCKSGIKDGKLYSDSFLDIQQSIDRNFIFPPNGGIFELKYPNFDIVGSVI